MLGVAVLGVGSYYPSDRQGGMKKHKHNWTTDGCRFYHVGGTRLWLFRKCLTCGVFQDAIVDTDKYMRWRPFPLKIGEPTP